MYIESATMYRTCDRREMDIYEEGTSVNRERNVVSTCDRREMHIEGIGHDNLYMTKGRVDRGRKDVSPCVIGDENGCE